MKAAQTDVGVFEQPHDRLGGAGSNGWLAQHQPTHVERVHPVDVLGRGNALGHMNRVDMVGQRQLHEDAVERRICVELVHPGQEFLLPRVGWKVPDVLHESDFVTVLAFQPHVDLGAGVVAHQQHREPRALKAAAYALAYPLGDAVTQMAGNGTAIESFCGHGCSEEGE